MAKLKYINKATGKSYTADAKDVAIIKANPKLKDAFTFEAEQSTPSEPITKKPAEEAK